MGDTQYCGRYYDVHGDIMSTVGVFNTVGENLLLFVYPHGTEHPHSTHDISTSIMISPMVLKLQRMVSPMILNTPTVLMIPHVHHYIPAALSIPHGTQDNPTVLMISPTVLNIPHGTQDIPHRTHDIPHVTEHPHGSAHPPRYCTHVIQGV